MSECEALDARTYCFKLLEDNVPKSNNPIVQWVIEVIEGDLKTLSLVHRRVVLNLYHRFKCDPHNQKSIIAHMENPIHLGSLWLESAFKMMMLYGCVHVNSSGGIVPFSKNQNVLKTTVLDEMRFPESIRGRETISFIQWNNKGHWYLHSSLNRLFEKEKFDTLEEAKNEARRFVSDESKWYFKDVPFMYTREGD